MSLKTALSALGGLEWDLFLKASMMAQQMKRLRFTFLICPILAGFFLSAFQAGAYEEKASRQTSPLAGTMDFSKAVGLLIQHSPFLVNSSVEIKLRQLDESDARFAFIPAITLQTRYFLNQPTDASGNQPYSIDFIIDAFNPVETYVTLQARKVITQMAAIGHVQVISDVIQRLGMGFLELEALEKHAELHSEWMELAEQSVAYYRTRVATGGATFLELRALEQELEIGQAEQERLAAARTTIRDGMKNLIGLREDQVPDLDLRDAKQQVISSFDPAAFSLEDARNGSIELKLQKLKVELQKRNVTLAYARYMPNLLLGVQTTDPLGTQSDRGLFFSVGLQLPLWDGLKRYNNITRQKTVLHQYNTESDMKDLDLGNKWRVAQDKLKETATQLKLARSQEELAAIREKQVEIGYKSGREPLSALLGEKRKHVDARKNIVSKSLEYDKAVLVLRNLSGDLISKYVDARSYEKVQVK